MNILPLPHASHPLYPTLGAALALTALTACDGEDLPVLQRTAGDVPCERLITEPSTGGEEHTERPQALGGDVPMLIEGETPPTK